MEEEGSDHGDRDQYLYHQGIPEGSYHPFNQSGPVIEGDNPHPGGETG